MKRISFRPSKESSRHRFRMRGLAFAIMAVLPALVQAADAVPGEVHLWADHAEGQDEIEINAHDNVRIERNGAVLTSDQARMDLITNDVHAKGDVLLVRDQNTVKGPRARVNTDTWFGEFESPIYSLSRLVTNKSRQLFADAQRQKRTVVGSGHAEWLYLEGENKYRLHNATYSSCRAADPEWYLKVKDLDLDYDREKGAGLNGVVVFQGVPILYSPWISFPLNGGRQSGLLPPTMVWSSNTGPGLVLPYYFNLAPNYDLTLAPRWMGRRGMQLGEEMRYLTPSYHGVLRTEYLANDQVTGQSRSLIAFNHLQDFGHGFGGSIDFNAVSDKSYFTDLGSLMTPNQSGNLSRQAVLTYGNGSWMTGSLQIQRFQNISGNLSDMPYERVPQLSLLFRQPDFNGFSLQMPTEFAAFAHPTQDQGRRAVVYPQVSYPILGSSFFFTPKAGVHLSRYSMDWRTATGNPSPYLSRAVPSVSLDSGLTYEREYSLAGREQIQTLEPRLYYVKTAYRDQSNFPVFDTARTDFNFAQIFSENVYTGQDRIADADQLTAGVQSRFINANSGEQWLSMTLAQRYYFHDQRVTLPSETPTAGRVADILAGLSGNVYRHVLLDAALQYDPRDHNIQRTALGLRYQPDYAKVVSLSYHYTRGSLRDLDVTFQWPIWDRWYGVGRYNPNLRDHQMSEALVGLEYKADCWVFRGVWQNMLTQTTSSSAARHNNSYFIQIELNDFAALGNNPVSLLRRNVSGYGKINEPPLGNLVNSDDNSNSLF